MLYKLGQFMQFPLVVLNDQHVHIIHVLNVNGVNIDHRFGLPSFFWTLSPGDMDSMLLLHLSGEKNNPANSEKVNRSPLNSSMPEDFFSIPDIGQRMRILAENPGHSATSFFKLVKDLSRHILRLPMDSELRKSTFPDISSWNTYKGALGHALAQFIAFEEQFRGSLHLHSCIWCALSPWVLSQIAHDPELSALVSYLLKLY
jgi:hypothetical protein